MISTRDLVFGGLFVVAVVLGGAAGGFLGGLVHLVGGACAAGGLVYLLCMVLGRF